MSPPFAAGDTVLIVIESEGVIEFPDAVVNDPEKTNLDGPLPCLP
jgi:hypothetical protein